MPENNLLKNNVDIVTDCGGNELATNLTLPDAIEMINKKGWGPIVRSTYEDATSFRDDTDVQFALWVDQ